MKFNKFIPLLFTLVILGCTSGASGGSGFSQTAGAVINDFSFDVSGVEDFGDQSVLTLSFQNVGGKSMNGDTFAYVYGPPLTMPDDTADRKWGILSGVASTEFDSAKQRITWKLTSTQFFPPDTDSGQPGMSQLNRVVLAPPKQDEGMTNIPYTFEARLCYPYKTTTSSIIRSIASNTYATVVSKKTAAETKSSAGPIQVSLKAGENIRANTGSGGATTTTSLPLVFEVRDVGGGFATDTAEACNPLVEKTKMGVLKVSVFVDGTEQDCDSAAGVQAGTVYIRNGVGNLFCTGNFPNANPKTEYHIVAQTSYNYYISKSATISVSDSKDSGDADSA